MDLKRRFSTGDIDPKVSRSAIGRSEFSPKLTRFENSLLTTTTTTESNRGRTMSSTDNVVNVVSPLKRKSSTSQIEMTSLHQCDAKRRRHHRRKPNKKWRHNSVTAEKSKSVCQNTASSTTSTAKCQKDKKLNGSANSNNCSSACQLLWKKKRKQQFFHQNSGATVTGTTSGQHNNTLQSQRLAGHGGACRKRANDVVLRPTKVPLLNAPRNSTQFIIDDHESSDLVWNFETRTTVPRHQQQPKEVSAPVESDAVDDSSSSSPPAVRRRISSDCENLFTSSRGGGGVNDDEDTFWLEFSERDFQSVYETAHQEEIAEWDRKKLVEEIASLERRHKELVKVLARLDPQVYVSRLQRELGKLQEQNRILKSSATTREPEMEINEVDPAVDKADGDVEEPDSNDKCKSSSQDETLPDSTND